MNALVYLNLLLSKVYNSEKHIKKLMQQDDNGGYPLLTIIIDVVCLSILIFIPQLIYYLMIIKRRWKNGFIDDVDDYSSNEENRLPSSIFLFQLSPYMNICDSSMNNIGLPLKVSSISILLLFRICAFLFGISCEIFEFVHYKKIGISRPFIFHITMLTNLSFIGFYVYYFVSTLLTAIVLVALLLDRNSLILERSKYVTTLFGYRWFEYVTYGVWVLGEINQVSALVVTVGFWCILVPVGIDWYTFYFSFIAKHGINTIVNLIEFTISNMRMNCMY
jgi:hypothetical protein